jgi:hypothetical protein
MLMPPKKDIDLRLLEELEKAGGIAKPSELYSRVSAHFPSFDLNLESPEAGPRWKKCLQWARQRLVLGGYMDRSTPGVWAITDAGRQRVHKKPVDSGKGHQTKKKAKRISSAELPASEHDKIAQALRDIGIAFGFESLWKPSINMLRPKGLAFVSKRKTLDVAWSIANLSD